MIFTNPDELYAQLTEQEKREIEEVQQARRSGKSAEQVYEIIRRQEISNSNQTTFTLPPAVLQSLLK